MALNAKREQFCQEYLIDLNQTQAAVRAGYSPRTANEQASRLLANVNVQERIAELKEERVKETKIDAKYVLMRHYEIDQMDFLDIMEDDGSLKRLSEWPKIFRQYLSGFELAELWEGRGEDREQIGMLKKIKWPDKVKNLELLGKHVDVQAYRDKLDHTSSDGSMSPSFNEERYKEAQESLSNKLK